MIYLATFEFTVPNVCRGKGRPRFRNFHGHVMTYTPKTTKDYEKEALKAFNKVARGKKLEGAVKLEICAIYEPPKSIPKKQREQMINNEIPYIKKPDLDNCIKAIADSCNSVAYADDACIDEIHAYKMYGPVSCCQVKLTDDKHVIKPFWFVKGES